MGTDLERMVLSFAAFKCNAVYKSLEVDDRGIAFLYRSVFYGNCSCVFISFVFYFFVYFFICYGCIDLCNGYTLVFS